ncbi:Uncharacterized protein LW93_4544 [Fusarium fujikuroi]|nr:Uncharacterized protein LW93_4544 [Fusarium fujikuroi]
MAQNGKGPDPKLSVSIFKKTIQSLDAHHQTPERAPEWNIEEELQKSIKTSRLNSAELSQPLCTAIQVARVDTFASIGVYPAAVVGHSSGEVAAAYAVGAITANEAIAIAFYRGLVAQLQTKVGDDIVFLFAGYAGMMGEAVRQVTHVDEAFKLRNVTVSTAPVLNEGKPVEIMTTLHRKRLTNNLDSEWWEVTIASYNGAVWTKHCSGEARSYGESLGDAGTKAPFLRKVGTRRCYESMARSGLNFGPEFQRLDQIKADTQEQRADAKVAAKHGDNVDYHLHPTIIDATLQLLRVVAS